jgi:putative phosphoesterase
MKLIVISDTHIPERTKKLPEQLISEIKNSDGVIHAGDFTSYRFYEELQALNNNFYAVKGNMDDFNITKNLPQKLKINIEGKMIGIMHGYGAPYGLEDILLKNFENEHIDILIFGHTHKSLWTKKNNVYILNPGTPTDYIFAKEQTYAVLSIEKDLINVEIKFIK